MQRLVPVVGLEPTRVSPTDFESVTSAIPSHRRWRTSQVYRIWSGKSRKSPVQSTGFMKTAEAVSNFAKEKDVGLIVLGHPINMNGTLGPRSDKVKAFGAKLEELSGIKVELFDERLSTANAHQILNQTNTRGQKRKDVIDEMSACLILQSYLDRERSRRE